MNRRKREILNALSPAVQFAMEQGAARPARDWRDVVGLAVRNEGSARELMIYGRIGGGGWFSDGISASDVAAALKDLGPGHVDVRINSGGGDVFDGVAMHSLLARHPGGVTTHVDGLAASAASFIMLAGDEVKASRNAMVMIHDAMTGTWGSAATHQRAIDLLALVSDNIADMYAEKAGEDVAYWRAKMTENGEDGVWYTGQSAYDAGLVDEVVGDDGDEDVDDRLSGWVDLLPGDIAARVQNKARGPEPVAWDPMVFSNLMKGVIA